VPKILEIRERHPAGESPARPTPSKRAGSESCVVRERSRLRSVDSESAGHVIEPRKRIIVEADGVPSPGRQYRIIRYARMARPTGVKERGMLARVTWELGRPRCFLQGIRGGRPGDQRPGPGPMCSSGLGGEEKNTAKVPLIEGNEVTGDEHLGVGSPRSTDEAGERTRSDPVEGRGRRIMESLEGKMTWTGA
jgi:hypothetical protein